MLAFLTVLFKLVALVVSFVFDKNAETKKEKQEVIKEVIDGVEKKDTAAITASFDRLRRL